MRYALVSALVSAALLAGCGSGGSSGIVDSPNAIELGTEHTCVSTAGGAAWCWGLDGDGQLGIGSTANALRPMLVTSISGVSAISAGENHTCAILPGGALACWGRNYRGQLGLGAPGESQPVPISVPGVSGATRVSAATDHSCALAAGGVKCWGRNDRGLLSGTTPGILGPVDVAGITTARALSAGLNHTCVLLDDATARCWGDNTHRQLGIASDPEFSATPVQVTSLAGAAAITVGDYHSCAIVATGKVMCWGDGDFGQVGVELPSPYYTADPVEVPSITGATSIAAGGVHTCAVAGGEVWCWGYNNRGQRGDGTVSSSCCAPNRVAGISGAVAVGAGGDHSCALLSGGGVKCWGANGHGGLGDGTTTQRLLPVDVRF